MDNLKEGQVIETNLGIALLLRKDEDMPNLWHILLGKDKSFAFDTNKNRAISWASAVIEHYEAERREAGEIIEEKMKELEEIMENKPSMIKNKIKNDTILEGE